MKIYPAIDLLNGACVRLKKGNFSDKTIYATDPIKLVNQFIESGCEDLHIVDLAGAKSGKLEQFSLIQKISNLAQIRLQVGGGVRSKEAIEALLSIGVNRVIIGSIAATHPDHVIKWLREYGIDKCLLALDFNLENNLPQIAIAGWSAKATIDFWQLLNCYASHFSELEILCTDIACDGMLQGPNIDFYNACYQRLPNLKFIASGGVSKLSDIIQLKSLPNISGIIVGTALYEKKISIKELLNVS